MKKCIDSSNEITVKVNCSLEQLDDILMQKGFKIIKKYYLDDIYFVPKELKIEELSVRDILKSAIILRDYADCMSKSREYTFTRKDKEFDSNGRIIRQVTVNCLIADIDVGMKFLEAIGYRNILEIIEDGKLYEKDGLTINIKDIKNGDNLIELEENDCFDSVEKLKLKLDELNLLIDESDFYVKKAEIELQKKINRLKL